MEEGTEPARAYSPFHGPMSTRPPPAFTVGVTPGGTATAVPGVPGAKRLTTLLPDGPVADLAEGSRRSVPSGARGVRVGTTCRSPRSRPRRRGTTPRSSCPFSHPSWSSCVGGGGAVGGGRDSVFFHVFPGRIPRISRRAAGEDTRARVFAYLPDLPDPLTGPGRCIKVSMATIRRCARTGSARVMTWRPRKKVTRQGHGRDRLARAQEKLTLMLNQL